MVMATQNPLPGTALAGVFRIGTVLAGMFFTGSFLPLHLLRLTRTMTPISTVRHTHAMQIHMFFLDMEILLL